MRRRIRRVIQWVVRLGLAGAMGWLCLPDPGLYPEGLSWSREVRDRNDVLLTLTLAADDRYRVYTPLEEISPLLIESTLFFEDRRFYEHHGVDPAGVIRSARSLVSGPLMGGSTITMQLARLRFGLYTRNPIGKSVQMFRAFQLERHYEKDAILEAYLNQAPYGANIEGVGAASFFYMNASPRDMNQRQAVALTVIPQSPTRRTPGVEANPQLQAAFQRLYARMYDELDALDSSYCLYRVQNRPRHAPHFTRRIMRDSDSRLVRSTLDLPIQQSMERKIGTFVQRREVEGINNAASILIDIPTREVLGYVGSANFHEFDIDGQVDGIAARRSPGSTLKPAIYALGIEEGRIHPWSLMRDGPMQFGKYAPQNFDGRYLGMIPASEALARSRNVPAVWLASRLQERSLYSILEDADFQLARENDEYGLALALGSAGVRMTDLARLYSALGDEGVDRPLRYCASDPIEGGQQLLKPESCWLTLEMIKNTPLDGFMIGGNKTSRPVYWKSGTSNGFCDGWAAGIFDRYVVVTWVGDFRGTGSRAFIARESAAPLMFEIIEGLRAEGLANPAEPRNAPDKLRSMRLCARSGRLPGNCCEHIREAKIIPGVSPLGVCEVHRSIFVDPESGLRLGNVDLVEGRDYEERVYEFWPSDVLDLYERLGIRLRVPPPYHPESQARPGADGRIPPQLEVATVSFAPLEGNWAEHLGIPLRASAAPDVNEVFWFVDGSYIGRAIPGESKLWQPAPGVYQVAVTDDKGQTARREVRIKERAIF